MPNSDQEPFAAFLALDWGDRKHVWALQPVDAEGVQEGEIEATPEAVEAWAAGLAQRFGGRPVAVALEQSRGALLFMLTKYAHLVLYPVHPGTLANYRKALCPSGAKDDPSDGGLLLDLLRRHRDRLRAWEPDTVEIRTLQFLVEDRRKLVQEKTRQSNRLTARLKLYFPQVLAWFEEVDSALVGDLLRRWPTLEELQKARPGTLQQFFHQHNCRSVRAPPRATGADPTSPPGHPRCRRDRLQRQPGQDPRAAHCYLARGHRGVGWPDCRTVRPAAGRGFV